MSKLIILTEMPDDRHTHELTVAGMVVHVSENKNRAFDNHSVLLNNLRFYMSVNDARRVLGIGRADPPGDWGPLKRILIARWVEEHCVLPCFAVAHDSSEFSYYFADGSFRRSQFIAWASGEAQAKTYDEILLRFPLDEAVGLSIECDEWCRQLRDPYYCNIMNNEVTTSFYNETDAVEFKLRWADYLV